jgi:hypothetical protein
MAYGTLRAPLPARAAAGAPPLATARRAARLVAPAPPPLPAAPRCRAGRFRCAGRAPGQLRVQASAASTDGACARASAPFFPCQRP